MYTVAFSLVVIHDLLKEDLRPVSSIYLERDTCICVIDQAKIDLKPNMEGTENLNYYVSLSSQYAVFM